MNEEIEDPYHKNDGNGSIVLNGNQDIYFNGCAKGALTYALKGWCVSSPQALNAVENDEGTVIKNMQNYLGSSEQVHEIEVTILQAQE